MAGGLSQGTPGSQEKKSGRPSQSMVPTTIKRLNEAEYIDSKFILDGKEVKQVMLSFYNGKRCCCLGHICRAHHASGGPSYEYNLHG